MNSIWCGVRMPDRVELHLFPTDSKTSACLNRRRGRDDVNFVMKGAPSAPGGCVCMRCWEIWTEAVL